MKKTPLTPYRASLLNRLPIRKFGLSATESRQLNECVSLGWARKKFVAYRGEHFEITDNGRAVLAES